MSVGEQDIEVTDDQGNESPRKSMTIGAVCKALEQEFPDISISKIRYLEDQGLLSPRRTQGGYRLFSEDDVDRLEDAPPLRRVQPRDELGPQDVDLPVQEPAAVRDLLLLLRQIVDELLEILVRQGRKIWQRFHRALSTVSGGPHRG